MKVTLRSRHGLLIQNIVFVVLVLAVLGLLAWLSTRYSFQQDWTAGARNTLSATSRELVRTIEGPLEILAFVRENEDLRRPISDLVGKYQQHKPDLTLTFVNPEADPQRTREAGISVEGELLLRYQNRSEHVTDPDEEALTNALQRVARGGERWIVFLAGHGERAPFGQANHDYSNFAAALKERGLTVQELNLAEAAKLPDNTSALVIASPQTPLLPGEVKLIQDYVAAGGHVWWMTEPGETMGLAPLAQQLGITMLPGTVVDANAPLFGIDNPAFILIAEYPDEGPTRDFKLMSLLPYATALDVKAPQEWHAIDILRTFPRSWTETGPIEGEVAFEENTTERLGPLTVGVALTHMPETPPVQAGEQPAPPPMQRAVVMGDGDFLSNTYLGNAGNLDLGLALANWLVHDDRFIAVPAKTAPDTSLVLTDTELLLLSAGFLVALPLALLLAGGGIWLRRRRR